MDLELPIWPTAHIASLDAAYNVSPSVVTKALPAFKKIYITCGQGPLRICHSTVLPPTTVVTANIHYRAPSVRGVLGNWLPNLVYLRVYSRSSSMDFAAVVKDNLSACHGLRTLTMAQTEKLGQGTFDAALSSIVAACPQVERICVGSPSISPMSDCKTLVAWLALPTALYLEMDGTDFEDELGAELATAMLTSNTLETIHLSCVSSLMRAILSPSSPPLLQQVRHLWIGGDVTLEDDPPPVFSKTDVATLAAKVAMTTRLESLICGSAPHVTPHQW